MQEKCINEHTKKSPSYVYARSHAAGRLRSKIEIKGHHPTSVGVGLAFAKARERSEMGVEKKEWWRHLDFRGFGYFQPRVRGKSTIQRRDLASVGTTAKISF